ncbi:unnamed protein product [Amoebophrya sp. A25]|nr:unnamed protein product [Amoebophrya sp. A25]|eukprot:GSA25T00000859001.1
MLLAEERRGGVFLRRGEREMRSSLYFYCRTRLHQATSTIGTTTKETVGGREGIPLEKKLHVRLEVVVLLTKESNSNRSTWKPILRRFREQRRRDFLAATFLPSFYVNK